MASRSIRFTNDENARSPGLLPGGYQGTPNVQKRTVLSTRKSERKTLSNITNHAPFTVSKTPKSVDVRRTILKDLAILKDSSNILKGTEEKVPGTAFGKETRLGVASPSKDRSVENYSFSSIHERAVKYAEDGIEEIHWSHKDTEQLSKARESTEIGERVSTVLSSRTILPSFLPKRAYQPNNTPIRQSPDSDSADFSIQSLDFNDLEDLSVYIPDISLETETVGILPSP